MRGVLPGGYRVKKKATKTAAVVTVYGADKMTPKGRKLVAAWLRKQAGFVEKYGWWLSRRFTARYIYR